jgi:membrane fusion protein (multidrug efflux system)
MEKERRHPHMTDRNAEMSRGSRTEMSQNGDRTGAAEIPVEKEGAVGASSDTGSRSSRPKGTRPVRRRGRRWGMIALIVVPILLVGAGIYYWFWMRPYESTDDAFIDSNVIPIAPRVPGQVIHLLVRDNQTVKSEQLLLELDPRDYQVRLAETQAVLQAAQSRLEQAKAQVIADQARIQQERANLGSAQAEAQRAQADLQRYQSVQGPAVSRSQLDLAAAQARSTAAAVDVARNRTKAAEAQVAVSQAGIRDAEAGIKRAEAGVRQATLDLSYTKIAAPEDGTVAHRTVESGAYVQTGQSLLALIPKNFWVTANFKETQLTHMRPGQPVQVRVDAYPKRRFRAHVDSIQHGSGARFSLFPPENASGNYVKVVQRVPVKIVFDDPAHLNVLLGPGMSVTPVVRVLDRGGAVDREATDRQERTVAP